MVRRRSTVQFCQGAPSTSRRRSSAGKSARLIIERSTVQVCPSLLFFAAGRIRRRNSSSSSSSTGLPKMTHFRSTGKAGPNYPAFRRRLDPGTANSSSSCVLDSRCGCLAAFSADRRSHPNYPWGRVSLSPEILWGRVSLSLQRREQCREINNFVPVRPR